MPISSWINVLLLLTQILPRPTGLPLVSKVFFTFSLSCWATRSILFYTRDPSLRSGWQTTFLLRLSATCQASYFQFSHGASKGSTAKLHAASPPVAAMRNPALARRRATCPMQLTLKNKCVWACIFLSLSRLRSCCLPQSLLGGKNREKSVFLPLGEIKRGFTSFNMTKNKWKILLRQEASP